MSSRNSFGKMLFNNNVEKFRARKDFLKHSQLRSVSKVMTFTIDELREFKDVINMDLYFAVHHNLTAEMYKEFARWMIQHI